MSISSVLLCLPPSAKREGKKESATKLELEITGALLEPSDRTNEEETACKNNRELASDESSKSSPQTLWSALRSKIFLKSFFLCFLSTGTCFMISINAKNYGITKIPDDEFITVIISLATFINGSTRILWGYLYDKFGFRPIFFYSLVFQLIFLGTYCQFAENKIYFTISNIALITILGIYFVIFTPLWMELFDQRLGNAIVVWGYFAFSFATIFQFMIIYFLNPLIGFEGVVWIEFGLVILCMYFAYKFEVPKHHSNTNLKTNL